MQNIIEADYTNLYSIIQHSAIDKLLIIHSKSVKMYEEFTAVLDHLKSYGITVYCFTDFSQNPSIIEARRALDYYNENKCTDIMAIGGGSAIDVAKCVKYWVNRANIFIAIPTTAGTGAESTQFATVYENNIKKSIESIAMLPDIAFLDYNFLRNVPDYTRKSTFLDIVCHCVESLWSKNSTEESYRYALSALKLINSNFVDYFEFGTDTAYKNMLLAANFAGRSIAIAKTTAGHAMCYKLTTMFGIAHGHAAALCDAVLYPFLLGRVALFTSEDTHFYLRDVFTDIATNLAIKGVSEKGENPIYSLLSYMHLSVPIIDDTQIMNLVDSVNIDRLQNMAIELSKNDIVVLYNTINTLRSAITK